MRVRNCCQENRNYSVIERECLAIVWGIMKFQSYLYGQEFLLETDPCAIDLSQEVGNGEQQTNEMGFLSADI